MTSTVLAKFEAYDRKIFWVVAGVGALALFAYVYFVSISVFAVVGRKEAEMQVGSSGGRVAELESEYATLDRSVDPALAQLQGFHEIIDPRYVSRDKAQGTLSLREEANDR